MKFRKTIQSFLLLLPFGLLITSPWLNTQVITPIVKYSEYKYIQGQLSEREEAVNELIDTFSKSSSEEFRTLAAELDLPYFVMFKENKVEWNTDLLEPPFYYKEFYRPTYYLTANGSYLLFTHQDSFTKRDLIVCVPLETSFSISNEYLERSVQLAENLSAHIQITSPSSSPYVAQLESGQYAFGIRFLYDELVSVYIILGLLCFIITWLAAYKAVAKKYLPRWRLYAFSLSFLFCWWMHWPSALFTTQIFSSSLFFGELFNISFGDLILIFSILPIIQHGITGRLNRSNTTGQSRLNWSLGLINFQIIWAVWVIYEISFNASSITITPSQFIHFNAFSVTALLMLACCITLAVSQWKNIANAKRWHKKTPLYISIAYTSFYLLGSVFLNYSPFLALIPILLLLPFISQLPGMAFIANRATGIVILSALFVALIEFFGAQKMDADKHLAAAKLVKTNDEATEFILANLDARLVEDEYVLNYIKTPLLFKNVVEQRLNKVYIPPYFSKYEVNYYFNSSVRYFGNDAKRGAELKRAVENRGVEISASQHFYRIPTETGLIHYVGLIPLQKDNIKGELIIDLLEKAVFDESVYPELLANENHSVSLSDNYDYAIYRFGKRQKSTLTGIPAIVGNNAKLQEAYAYKPDQETQVFIWKKKLGLFTALSSFGAFLTLAALLFLLIEGATVVQKSLREKKRINLPLRIRVILSLFSAIMLSFIILSVLTIKHTVSKYELEAQAKLQSKLDKINHYLNQPDLTDYQKALAELSLLFETDIDLFSTNGSLLYSTQKSLFDQGILTPLLDGNVQNSLVNRGNTELLLNQKVGNLNFLSAFGKINSVNENMILHLGYFAKERELNEEIQAFSVRLFNLYLLSLVILSIISAALIRYIIGPLQIIQKQLQSTNLSGNNAPIEWSSDDELGALVSAYNDMTAKLDESAKQLSESKQQEAWREMAQQVAHEIKNPLTPMKLSIQQLQRAWKDQHPKLESIFAKVTNVIISQVDSLSRIASEFSSFAKMPVAKPSAFEIEKILDELVTLHGNNAEMIYQNSTSKGLKVFADEEQLFRALNNLVKNGIQAVEPEKQARIEIRAEILDDQLKISIADNGSGIPENLQDKIFKPKFSTKNSGMGLGLAITQNIIESAGGSINFETSQSTGTRFFVLLPTHTA